MPGMVYTVGSATPGAMRQLEAWMADPMMLLIDVRLVPRSRWYPQWNAAALRRRWGVCYTHQHALGNVNYRERDKPVQLRGPDVEEAVRSAVSLVLAGYSLVLLCVCADEKRCHRQLIARMIAEAMREGEASEHV